MQNEDTQEIYLDDLDLIDETETRLNSNVSGDTVMELLFIGLRK